MTFKLPFYLFIRCFIFSILFHLTADTWAQPCVNWTVVSCGVDQTFSTTAGAGLATYNNGLGSSCYSSSGTGGQESIYKFYAPINGVYQFQTTTTANATVEYFYKSGQSDACVGTGWSCLGYTSSAINVDAIALNANDSIWILANSESAVTAVNQQFRITCLPNPCETITPILCGQSNTFSITTGYGHPSFYNGLGSSCYSSSGQGASEVFYSFTAPSSGTYQIRTTGWISGGTAEYFYKVDSGDLCSASGWSCLGYTTSTVSLDAINLSEGQTIYILVNAESHSTTTSQSFVIDCVNAYSCEEMTTVTCGAPIAFSASPGLGDPLFYNGLGTSCYSNSGQGGDQQIYQFEAQETGTYYFEVLSWIEGGTVEYFYKLASGDPCSASGWSCLGYRSSAGALDAINLDAGTSIYILANAEQYTIATQQTWQIRCAVPYACTDIQTIACDEVVTFTTEPVLSDPLFYNGLGTSCYSNSGQGGQERMYQFTAAQSGTYQIRTLTNGTSVVEYFYKFTSNDPCSASGWICLGYTGSIGNLDAINLEAGESIWILANSESTTIGANQQFMIDCAVPYACTLIESITCGTAQWVEVPSGYGNPLFYNGLGTSCYNGSGQGAGERIFSFTAPTTGTYLFEVLAFSISSTVEYFYKSATLDPCSSSGWNCLGYTGNATYLDAINLNANETIYILANAESSSLGARQLFQVRCGVNYPCIQMNQVNCGVNNPVFMGSGYGNPIYNNGLGSSCYSNSGQGGGEQIFQFVAPSTGTYTFSVTSASGNAVFEYFTMTGTGNPCLATGWQCLGYRSNPGNLGNRTMNAGEVIFILVNSESTTASNQQFSISCVAPNSISVFINTTHVACNNGANGELSLTISGGTSPYTVDWADIAGNSNVEDRQNLSAGIYTATITDAVGAQITQGFLVNEPFPLQIFSDVTHPSAVGMTDGSIQLTLVGAPSPYGTDWTDLLGNNNPEDRLNLGEGEYCVAIMDVNGCVTGFCEDLMVGGSVTLDATADLTYPSCNGSQDGMIDLMITGGQAPYTVDWSDVPGENNVEDRSDLAAGIYTVEITDSGNQTITRVFALSNPPALVIDADINNPTTMCVTDGTILLNVTGGNGPFACNWNNGEEGLYIDGLSAGEYCAEITDANGCVAEACYEIVAPTSYPISLNAFTSSVTCFGANDGAIDVTVDGACDPLEIIWDENATWNTLSIDALAPGQYHITVTDANGMMAEGVYTVVSPAALTVNLQVTQPTGTNTLDGMIDVFLSGGTDPFTFDWQDLAGVDNAAERTNLNPGTYCLTVTDVNGCATETCTELLETGAPLQVTVEIDRPCATLDNGIMTAIASGGQAPYTYDWIGIPGTDNLPVWENVQAGEYTVVVTDSEGSQVTETVTVVDYPELIVDYSVVDATSEISFDGSISLQVSGGVGEHTITWDGYVFEDPYNATGLGPGLYSVDIVDESGCIYELWLTVDAMAAVMQVTYEVQDLLCFEGGSGGIDVTVTGGDQPILFDWLDLPGTNNSEDRLFLSAGDYTVIVTDADGVSITETITVSQPLDLDVFSQITDASATGASDGSIEILVTGGTAPYNYDWLDVPGINNTMNRSNLVMGNYCVNITDANGCTYQECFDVDAPDHVEEESSFDFQVYPNPFTDEIKLNSTQQILGWEVLDLAGQVVALGNGQSIAAEHLACGTYVVRIKTAHGVVMRKALKVNH